MIPTLRLFFAVEICGSAAGLLADISTDLRKARAKVRWVQMDKFHMTLSFLGKQPRNCVETAVRAARRAASGVRPVRAAFTHLGAFPDWKRPRVVWSGLGEGGDELAAAANSLRSELTDEGFEVERKAFVPHATLGRVKSPHASLSARAENWRDPAAWESGHFDISEIVLYESRLSCAGPVYNALERIGLG